jgi:hypothetical protein
MSPRARGDIGARDRGRRGDLQELCQACHLKGSTGRSARASSATTLGALAPAPAPLRDHLRRRRRRHAGLRPAHRSGPDPAAPGPISTCCASRRSRGGAAQRLPATGGLSLPVAAVPPNQTECLRPVRSASSAASRRSRSSTVPPLRHPRPAAPPGGAPRSGCSGRPPRPTPCRCSGARGCATPRLLCP